MTNKNITMISASAGTGKTHTLTERTANYLKNNEVSSLIATTFSKKAAAEMQQRFRSKLIEVGKTDKAIQILNGKIGTINSVFGNIVIENAFNLGISPDLSIVETDGNDDNQFIKNVTADIFVDAVNDDDFQQILERLSISQDEWENQVIKICKQALQNNLNSLDESKQLSLDSITEILPKSSLNYDAIKKSLKTDIQNLEKLEKIETTKAFQENAPYFLAFKDVLNDEDFEKKFKKKLGKWNDWKAHVEFFLKEKFEKQNFFPESKKFMTFELFKNDHKICIEKTFEFAQKVMEKYQSEKQKQGLIDFTDQETKAYEI